MIESNWVERTATNPRIFNASKFRLAGIGYGSGCDHLELRVSLTSYKELLGTHYSSVTEQLMQEARETYTDAATEAGRCPI